MSHSSEHSAIFFGLVSMSVRRETRIQSYGRFSETPCIIIIIIIINVENTRLSFLIGKFKPVGFHLFIF